VPDAQGAQRSLGRTPNAKKLKETVEPEDSSDLLRGGREPAEKASGKARAGDCRNRSKARGQEAMNEREEKPKCLPTDGQAGRLSNKTLYHRKDGSNPSETESP